MILYWIVRPTANQGTWNVGRIMFGRGKPKYLE
jgi:hypothetical protein